MIDATDDWIWDFWTIPEGETHHLFFLTAPRSLGDPDLRHRHARVGHAVATDLRTWTRRRDALHPQPAPAYDDLACWTGSTVRDDDGRWWMFTSGLSAREDGAVQRVGASTSADLDLWERTNVVLELDPRWYLPADRRGETHWRDPYVVRGSDGWHMYLTAKTGRGGAVGHATSPDLRTWTVEPPLGESRGRFEQQEVVSLALVEGRWAAVFSCLGTEMPGQAPGAGGVWSVPVEGPGAAVDVDAACRLTDERLYVGRVVDGPGGPCLLAFRNQGPDGAFLGGVIDPVSVRWRSDGAGLALA